MILAASALASLIRRSQASASDKAYDVGALDKLVMIDIDHGGFCCPL